MNYIESLGKRAKIASREVARLSVVDKNRGLLTIGNELVSKSHYVLEENEKDVKDARKRGVSEALIDRLRLSKERLLGIQEGLQQVATLDNPIGGVTDMQVRPNGLRVGKQRVPLGVVGIIYESRPNVTADAFALCFKAGNAVILRGGSDAINSNKAIVQVIREALEKENIPIDAIILVEDVSREAATSLMKLNKYIDVLIPRGGAGLISTVMENSTIPVIETGTGNCHIYVDEYADLGMAYKIIENAKTQRLGVCNACESLVIHRSVLDESLPEIIKRLLSHNIEIRGDEEVINAIETMNLQMHDEISDNSAFGVEKDVKFANLVKPATDEDWGEEYLDSIISIKVVGFFDDAVEHINTYNTGHSDAIITDNYNHALRFLNEIDAAAVYVNASTRFTDGFEFGFGAEIGISTQKLHARGPMGLEALTTTKFVIFGDGQIRG